MCSSGNKVQQNLIASSRENCIPQILTVLLEIHCIYIWPLWPFVFCVQWLKQCNYSVDQSAPLTGFQTDFTSNFSCSSITAIILLHEKSLQFDWLRAEVFHLNLKYLHGKITNLLRYIWCVRDIWHKYHLWYFKIVSNFTHLTAREITYNNSEISGAVFMPNITYKSCYFLY